MNRDTSGPRQPWLPNTGPVVSVVRHHRAGAEVDIHWHERGQVVFADYGTMQVHTPGHAWFLSARKGLWIPPRVEHGLLVGNAELLMRTIYIASDNFAGQPAATALEMSPLLRELILEFTRRQTANASDVSLRMLGGVLLDELARLNVQHIDVLLGNDDRIIKITQALIADPADDRSLTQWASSVGASTKTLERLFLREVGMSFTAWRQRARILRSLDHLNAGLAVTEVAYRVGYSSASAFIAAFRSVLGVTPKHFMT